MAFVNYRGEGMLKRKLISILLFSCLLIVILTRCGNETDERPQENAIENLEKPEINIFTLYSMTNPDSGSANFLKALEMAKEEFPDYIINHETADVETYKTKIKMMIAANETPDIFFSWGGGFVQPFVEAGYVLALDDYLDAKTRGKLKPEALGGYMFGDQLYGLPSYLWVGVLYCNQEMFAQYNLKYPVTFDELLEVCKTFRKNDVTPIAMGMKDKWAGALITNAYIAQLSDAKLSAQMLTGETSMNNPAVVGAASRTLELVAAQVFQEETFSLTKDEAEEGFKQGQVPMVFMGSWLSGVLDLTAVAGKVHVVKFPLVNDVVDENQFFGGDNGALCVSASCAYPDETVAVCAYLAEQCAILDGGLVTWETTEESMENVNPLNREVMEIIADATSYVAAWDSTLQATATQEWLDLVAELYRQDISAEDFAKRLEAAVNK